MLPLKSNTSTKYNLMLTVIFQKGDRCLQLQLGSVMKTALYPVIEELGYYQPMSIFEIFNSQIVWTQKALSC